MPIGFDSLGSTLPFMDATVGQLSPVQKLRRTIRKELIGQGLNEIETYTLVSKEYVEDTYS
jgi:phenylalanyl-tRNA synthetase beta chain